MIRGKQSLSMDVAMKLSEMIGTSEIIGLIFKRLIMHWLLNLNCKKNEIGIYSRLIENDRKNNRKNLRLFLRLFLYII